MRSRWLGVFVRKDLVSTELCKVPFKFQHPKIAWDHPSFSFRIPKDLHQQLILDNETFAKYDAPCLLPNGRRNLLKQGTDQGVIASRLPEKTADLLTLVANYSAQHGLPEHHLKKAGIFAELTKTADGSFAFVDPCKWYALMGVCSLKVLSISLEIAYRCHRPC